MPTDPHYYDALIAKWPTLVSVTTAAKLVEINALTVTGQIPSTMFATGDQVFNCIVYSEFKALTAAQQTNMLLMLNTPGQLIGGSAHVAQLLPGMLVDYFGAGSATIAALTALAKGTVLPWWQATVAQGGGGLNGPVSNNDLVAAGGLT